MKVRHVLDDIVGQASKVALLRELYFALKPETGRRLAILAGLSPRASHQTLATLVNLGLVRQTPAGNALLFSLDRGHPIVQKAISPLFDYEKGREEEVFGAIKQWMKISPRQYLSLILFGSAGTRKEKASSDIDLLCVVPNAPYAEKARQSGESLATMIKEQYSKTLSFHVLTTKEFRERYRSGNDYVRDAVESGTLLEGKLVSELMMTHD